MPQKMKQTLMLPTEVPSTTVSDVEGDSDLEKELLELLKEDGGDDNLLDLSNKEDDESLLKKLCQSTEDDDSIQQPKKQNCSELMEKQKTRTSISHTKSDNQPLKIEEAVFVPTLPKENSKSVVSPSKETAVTNSTQQVRSNKSIERESINEVNSSKQNLSSRVRQDVLNFVNPISESNPGLEQLKNRHQEYKMAALEARNAGQLNRAKQLLDASKFIGEAIENIQSGKESFDPENDMPPPPSEFEMEDEDNTTQQQQPQPTVQDRGSVPKENSNLTSITSTPIINSENIKARMNYYKEKIKQIEGDSSQDAKKRRLLRTLTLYEEGLRACEHAVVSYAYEELPPPPGCPLLSDRTSFSKTMKGGSGSSTASTSAIGGSRLSSGEAPPQKNPRNTVTLLRQRQAELKEAARLAKQSGNVELAKDYLRSSLRMNQMISAAEAGLPIDLKQLPRQPAANITSKRKPLLSGNQCDPPLKYANALASSSGQQLNDMIANILVDQEVELNQLIKQHSHLGENAVVSVLKNLLEMNTTFRKAWQQPLKYKYNFEYANLPKSNVNLDLGDESLEVSIIRGIAYPLPSNVNHLDTYVEVEFALNSTDSPMKLSTSWSKHSNEPVYNQSTKEFKVNTKSRNYQRLLCNNRCLKATVYYSRGLLKSAGVLGVADIPLGGLVQSATVDHIGDLKSGRKSVGGRLEVRLRQRNSVDGESTIYDQKPWLIITPKNPQPKLESEKRGISSSSSSVCRSVNNSNSDYNQNLNPNFSPSHSSEKFYCLSVLQSHHRSYTNRLNDAHLSQQEIKDIQFKIKSINENIISLKHNLTNNEFRKKYLNQLINKLNEQKEFYKKLEKSGDSQQSKYVFREIQLIEDEINRFSHS